MKIAIEVLKPNGNAFSELQQASPEVIEFVDTNRLSGETDIIAAIVTISSFTLPLVANIITELIRSRQYVKVKVKGIEVSGLSESNAMEILKKYEKESHGKHNK
jgi:hypothetical protein